MQERGCEFLKVQLKTNKNWPKNMLKFFIILDQIFGVFLLREKFFQTLIGSFSDTAVDSSDQVEHAEDNVQPGLNKFIFLAFFLEHGLCSLENSFIEQDSL